MEQLTIHQLLMLTGTEFSRNSSINRLPRDTESSRSCDGPRMEFQYSLLTAFQNLGSMSQKKLEFIRPQILSQTARALVQATAKYDFDLAEPPAPSGNVTSSSQAWDTATWDSSVWGGDYTPTAPIQGAFGMGRDVAIAIRGQATSRTVLAGIGVAYTEGGPL